MNKDLLTTLLELTKTAAKRDEVPVGAMVVNPETNEIIAKNHNRCEELKDVTAHAEIIVIREAMEKLGVKRLDGYDLYVSLEPCTMCAGAISLTKIKNLYFGAEDKKGGAVINGIKFFEQKTCHHRPNVYCGFEEEKFSKILKDFFKSKRK